MFTPMMEIIDDDDDEDQSIFDFTRSHSNRIRSNDDDDDENTFDRSIFQSHSASNHHNNVDQIEEIKDLLALTSLLSHHVQSDHFLASESSLIRSKFLRLFHFLLTDTQHEPMAQASGDTIATVDQVDDALINLNRNATLKFRNYKQFRELMKNTSINVEQSSPNRRPQLRTIRFNHQFWFRTRDFLSYYAHVLIHNRIFTWFISLMICLDAVTIAVTTELNEPGDSQSIIYNIAVNINRLILFVYLFELAVKWLDDFTNYWYSFVNIFEFLLTLISVINFINEIYSDATQQNNNRFSNPTSNKGNTMQKIRWYGSVLSLLRTLRMLRVLRILEIAFRFDNVRIVFMALSRSVKLIFHVVILTVILNYFFTLIALYLTQFGINDISHGDTETIQSLFGTVPRAFITVFRLFTKDEWYEIKLDMYALNINSIIVDIYVISWLFFGGYVLNPLLVGAMVGAFDETRKEITDRIEQVMSKTRLSLNETTVPKRQSSMTSFSSLLSPSNSLPMSLQSMEDDQNQLDKWLRSTLDEIHQLEKTPLLSVQDRMETQWPIYTVFYYLQVLELYFENIAERQLLFDFFSIYLLTLHDKETRSIDPPILSSSSSSDDDDTVENSNKQ